MVIGEVVARECAVLARRFVEHSHMRFDALLINQPAEHLGRAIGAVAHKPGGIEIEASIVRSIMRLPPSPRPADRSRRLHVDDDRVVNVDQIVGRVGEEGLPAMGAGPTCCRIGR